MLSFISSWIKNTVIIGGIILLVTGIVGASPVLGFTVVMSAAVSTFIALDGDDDE